MWYKLIMAFTAEDGGRMIVVFPVMIMNGDMLENTLDWGIESTDDIGTGIAENLDLIYIGCRVTPMEVYSDEERAQAH